MATMMDVYLIDQGVLLNKDDKEFDSYAVCYDKKHGFYDEDQYYSVSTSKTMKDELVSDIIDYVTNGVPGTYTILSQTCICEEDFQNLVTNNDFVPVEGETYLPSDVLWSLYKDENGDVHFNFIEGQLISQDFPDKLPEKEQEYDER